MCPNSPVSTAARNITIPSVFQLLITFWREEMSDMEFLKSAFTLRFGISLKRTRVPLKPLNITSTTLGAHGRLHRVFTSWESVHDIRPHPSVNTYVPNMLVTSSMTSYSPGFSSKLRWKGEKRRDIFWDRFATGKMSLKFSNFSSKLCKSVSEAFIT